MYLKNYIKDDYKMWKAGEYVFINAPTGTGKTTFVINELMEYAKENEQEVLYISNRFLLKEQIKMKILKRQGINANKVNNVEEISEFEGITILSYQKVQALVESRNYKKFLSNRYKYVVFDEIHYVLEDAIFNPLILFIMEFIKEVYQVKIFMSATIEETKDYLIKSQVVGEIVPNSLEYINCYTKRNTIESYTGNILNYKKFLWQYEVPKKQSNINVKYYDDIKAVCDLINESSGKWLIFVSSKEKAKKWIKELKGEVVFVSADDKNGKVFEDIVKNEKFDSKVLITTKLLDNGINFCDIELNNLIIETIDRVEFLQMLGRKRLKSDREEINLYIPKHNKKFFSGYLHLNVEKSLDLINKICDSDAFYNWILREKEAYELARRFIVFINGELRVNSCAIEKLKNLQNFLKYMIKKFDNDEWAFVREQLRWIDLEESFDEANYIGFIDAEDNKKQIITYLQSVNGIELDKDEQEWLKEKIQILTQGTNIEIKCKKNCTIGKKKINDFLKENNLPFELISKKGQKKGQRTKWIIKKEELTDGICC